MRSLHSCTHASVSLAVNIPNTHLTDCTPQSSPSTQSKQTNNPKQVIDAPGAFLDLVVQHYDVVQHLDGQPLQSMVKDKASGALSWDDMIRARARGGHVLCCAARS